MTSNSASAQAKRGGVVSDTMMYGVATVLSQMASLILLPIYTRALTPRDYGVLDLMQLIVDFTGLFVSMRLGEAIFRFYTGGKDSTEGNETVSSSMVLALIMGAVGFFVIALSSGWLASRFFEDDTLTLLIILMGGTLLLQPLVELPAALIRAQQRPKTFLAFRVGGLVLRIGLNLILVVWLRMGVAGAVYANLCATAIQAVAMSIYTISCVGVSFRWERARAVIGFSVPILVASIGSYYIGFADRYFLKIFGDLEAVGLYSMAARFGLAYFAFGFTPFEMAWDAERYNVAKRPDAVPVFQQTFLMISAYLLVLAFAMSLFADEVLRIMSAEPFWAAAPLIPIFVLNSLIMGWGSYARFGLFLQKKTSEIAKGTWYSIPVTTIAFVTLIPMFGMIGAAIAVMLGNAFRVAYIQHAASRVFDMQLQWGRVLAFLGVLALVTIASMSLRVGVGLGILIDCLLLGASALLAWFGPLLEPEDRQLILRNVKTVVGRLRPA
jgi:O-antigen/teichoic acid export membrane protein